MPHIQWPAVPEPTGALLLALMFQLDQSEYLPPETLEQLQMGALHRLLGHAASTVPYYRNTPGYAAAAARPSLTGEQWRRQVPILSRSSLQEAGPAMRTERLPAGHEPVSEVITTGSTGRPVRALSTRVTGLFWQAITLRDMLWHERDMRLTLAAIRADRSDQIPAGGMILSNWAPFLEAAYPTGRCALMSITNDIPTQARWLVEQNPEYLLSYPSNILALADHFHRTGTPLPRLREVWTYGEALRPEVRPACAAAWRVPVVDMYSSQEIGYIALQCPENSAYHVQSEAVYVEILDGAGEPCRPGEVGRVVVSALHNYATPLLRYEIGDYAEQGGPCVCERTLPVLNRIVGRERNMWVMPNGQRMWPMFPSTVWGHIRAIQQMQVVQHEVGHIELRLVGPRALTTAEEAEVTGLLRRYFPWPFELTLTYLREIDRGQGMKFEDYISLVGR